MWFIIILPIIASGVCLYLFRDKLAWFEIGLPIIASAIIILSFKAVAVHCLTSDTCYHGALITSARYYESWDTWVEETCSYCCGTDSKGNCNSTCYRDCSYCSYSNEYWLAYDDLGHSHPITQEYYNELQRRWKSTPAFINLHRNINYSGGCGKDGNAYAIYWNNDSYTSEPASEDISYQNKIKACRNSFSYEKISDEDAAKKGLYAYPKLYNDYKQDCILGLSKLNAKQSTKDSLSKLYAYFNGYYGNHKHVRLFVNLYYNKPLDIALDQEAYWVGGNRNEVDVCIGVDSLTNKLNWVYAFSWCDNKRIEIDCREDIMNLDTLNLFKAYPLIATTIEKNYKPKDFKQFDYLTIQLPTWCYWVTTILVLIASGVSLFWGITNEITVEKDGTIDYDEYQNRYHYDR